MSKSKEENGEAEELFQIKLSRMLGIDAEVAATKCTSLTPKELEYARLMAKGTSNNEIAEKLNISPKTGDIHRANVKRKFGEESTAGIARVFWVGLGVLEFEEREKKREAKRKEKLATVK